MVKKLLFACLILAALFNPSFTDALTATPSITPSNPTTSDKNNEGFRLVEPTVKQKIIDKMTNFESKKAAINDNLMRKKDNREQKIKALQLKLQSFKDLRKRNIIINLDEKIASISSRRTERMTDALEKLENILSRIETKSNELTGCDKLGLNNAISEAKSTIQIATAAVEIQAAKSYDLNISTEDAIKTNVGTTLKLLTQDLRTTHQKVVDAKQAVVKATGEVKILKSCVKASITPSQISLSPSGTLIPTPSISQ